MIPFQVERGNEFPENLVKFYRHVKIVFRPSIQKYGILQQRNSIILKVGLESPLQLLMLMNELIWCSQLYN